MYVHGRNLRILDFRRKGEVSCDFWETPFCDHHLESSVANDWGKNIRDHGVKHYAEHEGPPALRFTVCCQTMSYEVCAPIIVYNVSKWAEFEDPRF